MSDVEAVTVEPTVDAPQVTDTVKTDEARFTQADLDRIVKERLEREQSKAAKAAEKAAAEERAKALAEQGEFKKLHEQTAARVAELEPIQERYERMAAVLGKRWEAEKATVPDYILPLLEKMDVDERLDYITENREKWTKAAPPNINAGNGAQKRGGLADADKQAIAAKYGVDPRFIPDSIE